MKICSSDAVGLNQVWLKVDVRIRIVRNLFINYPTALDMKYVYLVGNWMAGWKL
jgi:hypothetical protein